MNKIFISLSVFAVLLMFTLIFLLITPKFGMLNYAGDSFCEKQGYDHVSWSGRYSELFGKINCVSCYNGKCQSKEFDVTEDWMGHLHELDDNQGESVK